VPCVVNCGVVGCGGCRCVVGCWVSRGRARATGPVGLTGHAHTHTRTQHLKLLSSSSMSEASLAMEVPEAMANPQSAALSAGASLVPSPGVVWCVRCGVV
jgi:hypothetical protein